MSAEEINTGAFYVIRGAHPGSPAKIVRVRAPILGEPRWECVDEEGTLRAVPLAHFIGPDTRMGLRAAVG